MKQYKFISRMVKALVMLMAFLVAPVIGVMLRGDPITPYLAFPPLTTEAERSSFSWIAFLAVMLFVVATTWPFWYRMVTRPWRFVPRESGNTRRWPWWGWAALAGLILFWTLAWNRFAWFEPLQRFTFFPIWICFILLLNAVAFRISGHSLLTRHPFYFALLFPASAAFWWTFEYLNRFVANWHYVGTYGIGGWQYFIEATVAFSTVLPAVMSIRYLLNQTEVFVFGFRDFPALSWLQSRALWAAIGVLSVLALVLVGWLPNFTYPLVWIVPGLLWVAWQRWNGYVNPILEDASKGDLTLVWSSAFATLLCGIFWEMWNLYSQAKWIYSTPALNGLYLFEMPLAGYAGYLPFGVVCALVAHSLLSVVTGQERVREVEREADHAGVESRNI